MRRKILTLAFLVALALSTMVLADQAPTSTDCPMDSETSCCGDCE